MNKIYIAENNHSKGHFRSFNAYSTIYHLTNQEMFVPNRQFTNEQQEFGTGLYVTDKESIRSWDWGLGGRNFVVVMNLDNANIIHEKDFPKNREMVQFLKSQGFGSKDLKDFAPTGDTFGRNPVDIATKRAWMFFKKIDVVIPFKDRKEGNQMIVLNLDKIRIIDQISMNIFYKEFRHLKN